MVLSVRAAQNETRKGFWLGRAGATVRQWEFCRDHHARVASSIKVLDRQNVGMVADEVHAEGLCWHT